MLHKRGLALLAVPLFSLLVLGCSSDPGPKGDPGAPGPAGPEGPGGDPSISAVSPGKAFLARTVDVTVSGYNTSWTEAATLDFGPGINVVSKTLASPTAIVATIEVTDKAAEGPRDVVVTDSGKSATYKGAFKVQAPLEVSFDGTMAQGSVLLGHAKQLDLSTPFDTTQTGDGLFTPIEYPNIVISTSLDPMVGMAPQSLALYSTDFLVFADVNAPAGDFGVSVDSGPASGDIISSPAPAAGKIEARQPVELTLDGPTSGKVDVPFATLLFSYTPPAAGKILSIQATPSSKDATPGFVVLPKSGSFADLISFSEAPTVVANSTDPFYFVYWDNTGVANYTVDVKIQALDTQEVEPNDACAKPQTIAALPANLENMTLSSEKDVDWYAITLTEADVGKSIHVVTSPGDDQTDTLVDVVSSNCTTSLGGPSDDSDYHEDFTSTAVKAPGTYYVKVSNSTYGYTGTLYNLTIELL